MSGGVVDVHVPRVGMSSLEVDVGRIHVAVGDVVDPETMLLDVDSDKVTFGIPSPIQGTVEEILVEQGHVCQVGAVVVRIRPVES